MTHLEPKHLFTNQQGFTCAKCHQHVQRFRGMYRLKTPAGVQAICATCAGRIATRGGVQFETWGVNL